MKINQEIRSTSEAANRQLRVNLDEHQKFKGLVQSQASKLQNQEVENLLNNISKQGNKLASFRSLRDLAKFKQMIKRLLKETTSSGLKWQSGHHFDPSGQGRKLALVKEVDEKLIELTEAMMSNEKKTVDLLGIIGEIKGLLLNIYA